MAKDSGDTCRSEQGWAEFIRERAHQSFVAFSKRLQDGALAGAFVRFCDAQHPANDTAPDLFGFVKLREGASDAEALRISCVNPRNKRAHQAVEKLRRKFPPNERGDGFVGIGRNGFAEDVAQESPFCRGIDEGAHEKGRRTKGHWAEFAVDQHITRGTGRGLQQFIRNAEIEAMLAKRSRATETLRAEFQKEAVASDGVDDTTGTGRGFD